MCAFRWAIQAPGRRSNKKPRACYGAIHILRRHVGLRRRQGKVSRSWQGHPRANIVAMGWRRSKERQEMEPANAPNSTEGWTWVIGSSKWHYFAGETTSLCKKWWVPFLNSASLESGNDDSRDNCALCRRTLVAQRRKDDAEKGEQHSGEGGSKSQD